MGSVSTTRMSSKGQVVIPEDIRRRLGLNSGTQFLVLGEDDVVILKMVRPPAMGDFDRLVKKARAQARAGGAPRAGGHTGVGTLSPSRASRTRSTPRAPRPRR